MTRWQTTIRGSDAICWGSFVTPTYELGYKRVYNVTNGITAWIGEGNPVVR